MASLTLRCVVAGAAGRAFSVAVDADASVAELQRAIQRARPCALGFVAASALPLFLAKRGGAWLTAGSSDEERISRGEVDRSDLLWLQPLDQERRIGECFRDAPASNAVHVIVGLADGASENEGATIDEFDVDLLDAYLADDDGTGQVPQSSPHADSQDASALLSDIELDRDILDAVEGSSLQLAPSTAFNLQLGESTAIDQESSVLESDARRRRRDAVSARRVRARKKSERKELEDQVGVLLRRLEQCRRTRKLARQHAEWEERAVVQRLKLQQAEVLNEQLKRAVFQRRSFIGGMRSVFLESAPLSPGLSMSSLLHSYTRLGRDPRARFATFQAKCTNAKLEFAMEILLRETSTIPFASPSIAVHKICTPADEFGVTTVAVYALDTIDLDQIFGAAYSAILNCESNWANYTLLRSVVRGIEAPSPHIRYGMSTARYRSDITGEELELQGGLMTYYRVMNSSVVMLWDFTDEDELHPIKPEVDVKRSVTGAVLIRQEICEDGVQRVVCRKICTKTHSFAKPAVSQKLVRFSQHRALSAQAHACWVYDQIHRNMGRPTTMNLSAV